MLWLANKFSINPSLSDREKTTIILCTTCDCVWLTLPLHTQCLHQFGIRDKTHTEVNKCAHCLSRMDEACSNVRVELDSKPEIIDGMERLRIRLQVEQAALKKEKDPISVGRLEQVCGQCLLETCSVFQSGCMHPTLTVETSINYQPAFLPIKKV